MLGTCELQDFSQEYGALGDTQIDEAMGDRGKRVGVKVCKSVRMKLHS